MKKQILIVDDELTILKTLEFILSKEYDLVIKHNVREALQWVEEGNKPSVILSDLEMPGLDGAALIGTMKMSSSFRNIPIILLSGATDLLELVKRMPFKPNMVLEKPLDPMKLKKSIGMALKSCYV